MDFQQKSIIVEKSFEGGPENFREEQYLHIISSEKRHELLFEPFGVSFSEFRTLQYLREHTDGIEPSKIADELMLLRQNMTHIVDGLQKRGLVERVPHTNDRRRICVHLLPDGEKMAERLYEIECDYTRRIYQHFTQEEGEMYRKLVRKMAMAKEIELNKILEERNAAQG